MKATPTLMLWALLLSFLAGPAWGATPLPPRAPASVHLFYQAPACTIFYNTVRIEKSQRGSYFQVCGFNQGYFGLQELGNKQHVLIFSVWDSHHRKAEVQYHAHGIRVTRFGGEGTGVHILYRYHWVMGKSYHFAVIASKKGKRTDYAAWFYRSQTGVWEHLVTFSTLSGHSAGLIQGLYSFIEDFRRDTISNKEVRRAFFGPGWVRTATKRWQPLSQAIFNTSDARWEDQKDVDGGVIGNHFYLQNGGDTQIHHTPGTDLKIPNTADRLPTILKKLLAVASRDARNVSHYRKGRNG